VTRRKSENASAGGSGSSRITLRRKRRPGCAISQFIASFLRTSLRQGQISIINIRLDFGKELRIAFPAVARPLRIEIENGWYHVLNRGLEGRQIFPDNDANQHFLELLGTLPTRFGVRIHSYVLMGNHYHLQIETPKANLSRAMQWLNLSYSAWFNRLHSRKGPLFQGRFKAILLDPEESVLAINRYIHLNPVRIENLGGHELRASESPDAVAEEPSLEVIKERVEMLTSYRWSSYPVYVGKIRNPGWLTTDVIHGFFGNHTLPGLRGAYRRQLEEMAALGRLERTWLQSIKASVMHGSERFTTQTLEKLQGNRREQGGLREKERMTLDWSKITETISKVWDNKWGSLSTRRGNGALGLAYYLGQRYAGLRLRELGQLGGGVEYPAVGAAIARTEKRLKTDRELQKRLKQVTKMLNIEM
jgi:putative transposase